MKRAQGGFGLRRSACRLKDGDGKEFGIEIGAIRSQKVDSDGVGAMISTRSGTDRLIEFSDTLQSKSSFYRFLRKTLPVFVVIIHDAILLWC